MAKPKPILRTRTVSTKVTEDEFAGLEFQAMGRNVNLGEWVREGLLERVRSAKHTVDVGAKRV